MLDEELPLPDDVPSVLDEELPPPDDVPSVLDEELPLPDDVPSVLDEELPLPDDVPPVDGGGFGLLKSLRDLVSVISLPYSSKNLTPSVSLNKTSCPRITVKDAGFEIYVIPSSFVSSIHAYAS